MSTLLTIPERQLILENGYRLSEGSAIVFKPTKVLGSAESNQLGRGQFRIEFFLQFPSGRLIGLIETLTIDIGELSTAWEASRPQEQSPFLSVGRHADGQDAFATAVGSFLRAYFTASIGDGNTGRVRFIVRFLFPSDPAPSQVTHQRSNEVHQNALFGFFVPDSGICALEPPA